MVHMLNGPMDPIRDRRSSDFKSFSLLVVALEGRPGAHWFLPSVDRRDPVLYLAGKLPRSELYGRHF